MRKSVKMLSAAVCSAVLICSAAPAVHAEWQTSEDGRNMYYSEESGSYLTGFQEIDGKKYYFDKDGFMRTGWLKRDGNRFFLNKDGTVRTGKLRYGNGNTYWFREDGTMIVGWNKTAKGIYYMNEKGLMTKDTSKVIDGILYRFSETGEAAPVIYSKKMLKKKPGKFIDPQFGMSLKDISLSCGMGYISQLDDRTFSGRVKYQGTDAELVTAFNEFGQLYYWQLGVQVPYSSFEKTLNNIKALEDGDKVNVRDGVYYWVVNDPDGNLHSNLFLKYDNDSGVLYYGWSSYIYSD